MDIEYKTYKGATLAPVVTMSPEEADKLSAAMVIPTSVGSMICVEAEYARLNVSESRFILLRIRSTV